MSEPRLSVPHPGYLLPADILTAPDDRPVVREEVPEWGGVMYFRGMMGDERDAWEQANHELLGNWRGLRARTVAAHNVTPEGVRIAWSEAEIDRLGKRASSVLDRLFATCQKLSGITAGDVAELEKNLPTAQNGRPGSSSVSTTESPAPSSSG